MWSFASSLALLFLPLPLLVRRALPPRQQNSGAIFLPSTLADRMTDLRNGGVAVKIQRVLPGLIWVSLVLALAGPQKLATSDAVPVSGRDIVLALDLSGSMVKQDFVLDGEPLSRLEAVRRVGAHFVRGRAGDRVGLVIFGSRAYFASPLTFDTEAVARAIEGATIGISGRSTAISDGLGLAVKRLAQSEGADSKVVILLSDGADTAGSVDAGGVAKLAARHSIRVHTVALGPDDLETNPASRDVVDTEALRIIAQKSGGETFRVRNMSDLSAMTAALNQLEPSLSGRPPLTVQQQFWIYPAIAALFAALTMALFGREAL